MVSELKTDYRWTGYGCEASQIYSVKALSISFSLYFFLSACLALYYFLSLSSVMLALCLSVYLKLLYVPLQGLSVVNMVNGTLTLFLSFCLSGSVFLSVRLFVCLSVCVSVYLWLRVSVCLSWASSCFIALSACLKNSKWNLKSLFLSVCLAVF